MIILSKKTAVTILMPTKNFMTLQNQQSLPNWNQKNTFIVPHFDPFFIWQNHSSYLTLNRRQKYHIIKRNRIHNTRRTKANFFQTLSFRHDFAILPYVRCSRCYNWYSALGDGGMEA